MFHWGFRFNESKYRIKIRFYKLQQRKKVGYEIEYQKSLIIARGDQVINVLRNDFQEALILYQVCSEQYPEVISLRIRIINKKGIRRPEPLLIAIYHEVEDRIHLCDIQIMGNNRNRGYGTILMKQFLDIFNSMPVSRITGDITDTDWDHINILKTFYEKYGFNVKLDLNSRKGSLIYRKQVEYEPNI